jgi:hypothetical protein
MLGILQNAYSTEAMSSVTLFRWWKHFKHRNKRVIADAQSGTPQTAEGPDIIVKAAI